MILSCRCQNISELWNSNSADPSWITFSQIFNATGAPTDIYPNNGAPIVSVRGQVFPGNQYHYFEFLVQNGDAFAGTDARRDNIFLTLVSPQSIPVAKGQVSTVSSVDSAKLPAYDFYVGQVSVSVGVSLETDKAVQGCIPQEGSWNNQGYGNINANEKVKSINVNGEIFACKVWRLGGPYRLFSYTRWEILYRTSIAQGEVFVLLLMKLNFVDWCCRYSVAAFDFTMKLSRGSMVARHQNTRCTQLVYRCARLFF